VCHGEADSLSRTLSRIPVRKLGLAAYVQRRKSRPDHLVDRLAGLDASTSANRTDDSRLSSCDLSIPSKLTRRCRLAVSHGRCFRRLADRRARASPGAGGSNRGFPFMSKLLPEDFARATVETEDFPAIDRIWWRAATKATASAARATRPRRARLGLIPRSALSLRLPLTLRNAFPPRCIPFGPRTIFSTAKTTGSARPAAATAHLRPLLIVGRGRCHKDLVSDNDRLRPAVAWDFRLPLDVLHWPPFVGNGESAATPPPAPRNWAPSSAEARTKNETDNTTASRKLMRIDRAPTAGKVGTRRTRTRAPAVYPISHSV